MVTLKGNKVLIKSENFVKIRREVTESIVYYAKNKGYKTIKLELDNCNLNRESNVLEILYSYEAYKLVNVKGGQLRVEDELSKLEVNIQLKEDFSKVSDTLISGMVKEINIGRGFGNLYVTTSKKDVYGYDIAFNVSKITILNAYKNSELKGMQEQEKSELGKVLNILTHYGSIPNSGKKGQLIITNLGHEQGNKEVITLISKGSQCEVTLYQSLRGVNQKITLKYDRKEGGIFTSLEDFKKFPNGTQDVVKHTNTKYDVGLTQQRYEDFYKYYEQILEKI